MNRIYLEIAPNGGWLVMDGSDTQYQRTLLASVGSTDELLKYLAEELRGVTPPPAPAFNGNGSGK